MYNSQHKQDEFLNLNVFKNKKGGIFVDIGAHDGITISNTYFYEKSLEWTGICIEPSPQIFEKLKINRTCIIENCAINDVEGINEFINIIGNGSFCSGFNDISGKIIKTAKIETIKDGGRWEIINVPTFRLDTILNKYEYKTVDYCSIDVEGFEINVVKSINWNNYNIQYISVEKNSTIEEVINYLKDFSYSIFTDIGGDFIFKLNR